MTPFVDRTLGEFEFDHELGWKRRIELQGVPAELVFGSEGEPPSEEMLHTAHRWLNEWVSQKPKIVDYMRRELRDWDGEPEFPNPNRFVVQSINILWPDKPRTSMIYFDLDVMTTVLTKAASRGLKWHFQVDF